MHRNPFTTNREGYYLGKVLAAGGMSALLLLGQTVPLLGNPTGGTVVAGGAIIGAAGPTLSITQSTHNAIVNWQQFSIANGETTKFFVPGGGATLNRVTGANLSAIYGNLQSNGALYLVNPNGIVVGPSGRINTASFLASTLDVSNQQFMSGGNLEFAGTSGASVENDGLIHAASGDVYLIANQVTNKGALIAPQGTVGLAAGSDVLFQQAGNQHLFVQATPAGAKRALGVTNAGTIRAAAAELKAAGGNAYALAINNTGVIAATGFKKVNGQVYLTSDGGSISNSGRISAKQANGNGGTIALVGTAVTSKTSGTVSNSGTLDASATVAGGMGGNVTIKNMGGKTVFTGNIIAKGGQGGTGGNAEVSGYTLQFSGLVDLTAPGGKTGTLLLDPATLDVIRGGTGTVVSGQNDSTSTTISPNTVVAALNTANLTLNADESITISNAITWTSANTLTLSTNDTEAGGITINAPISGVNGGLTISASSNTTIVSTGVSGSINVGSFILEQGAWNQVAEALPAFTAHMNFEIQGGTFVRALAGDGSQTPYQITDIYGLQGLSSLVRSGISPSAELVNNIDATGTSSWNGGAGFVPIGGDGYAGYENIFNGQGFTINGIFINRSVSTEYVGPFGLLGETEQDPNASVENLNFTNEQITGDFEVGGVVGGTDGIVNHCTSSGTVSAIGTYSGDSFGSYSDGVVGGIVGGSSGIVENSSSSDTVNGGDAVGGLVGANGGGIINTCQSSGPVTGISNVGGLVGEDNGGVVENSSSTSSVTGTTSVGGLIGGGSGGTVTNSNGNGSVNGNGSGTIPNSNTPIIIASSTQLDPAAGPNIVPPVLVPQNNQVSPPAPLPPPPPDPNLPAPAPVSPKGGGVSTYGDQGDDLSYTSSYVTSVDAGQHTEMGNDGVSNASNPNANDSLGEALGPIVYQNLADALRAIGDWADVPDSSNDTAGGGSETILTGGDVAEVTASKVKNIPLSQAPAELQKAMKVDVLKGVGH